MLERVITPPRPTVHKQLQGIDGASCCVCASCRMHKYRMLFGLVGAVAEGELAHEPTAPTPTYSGDFATCCAAAPWQVSVLMPGGFSTYSIVAPQPLAQKVLACALMLIICGLLTWPSLSAQYWAVLLCLVFVALPYQPAHHLTVWLLLSLLQCCFIRSYSYHGWQLDVFSSL